MSAVPAFFNNVFSYPVAGLPWTVVFPILDNTGALVSGAAGLDSEISIDGDTPVDCTNEATEIGSSGMYYLTLIGVETYCNVFSVTTKTSTTDAKTTPMVYYPKKFVVMASATCQGGGSFTATLNSVASPIDQFYRGMAIQVNIDGTSEYRLIIDYNGTTKVATIGINDWVTAVPDSNDNFVIYATEDLAVALANVVAINSLRTDGNNATLNLKQLNLVNSTGDALVASSTGSNGHGINASGNGTGRGMKALGGATGYGLEAQGGATSGSGMLIQSQGSNYEGVIIQGNGAGAGLWVRGGATGHGIHARGGTTSGDGIQAQGGPAGAGVNAVGGATSGNGLSATATAGNGHGVSATGQGSGDGLKAASGATGVGLHVVGGSSSGDGMKAEAAGSGLDISAPNSDVGVNVLSIATDAITAASIATDAITEIATGVWASGTRTLTSFGTLVADVATAVWAATTRLLTAGTNIVLAKGVGLTGLNDLSQADVRSAVGLVAANLDTQLAALATLISGTATPAQVASAIAAALATTTYAEPTGVPGNTVSIQEKVGRIYQVLIDGLVVDSNTGELQFKNAAGTVLWKKTFTDVASVYTESAKTAP